MTGETTGHFHKRNILLPMVQYFLLEGFLISILKSLQYFTTTYSDQNPVLLNLV